MAETELSRSDRVNIDDSVIQVYKDLTEDPNIEQSPFRTYKDVFMFAACLGYRRGSHRQLPAGKKHTIRREVFAENDFTLLKAMAIAATGDVDVLLHLGDILTIAEEYAHTGIHDLKAHLLDQRGRPLWNLVELLNSNNGV
jgi:dnd system-associated protein 4